MKDYTIKTVSAPGVVTGLCSQVLITAVVVMTEIWTIVSPQKELTTPRVITPVKHSVVVKTAPGAPDFSGVKLSFTLPLPSSLLLYVVDALSVTNGAGADTVSIRPGYLILGT